jgi:hypothetical protein
MRGKIIFFFVLFAAFAITKAQSPTPVIVQAANTTAPKSTTPETSAAADVQSIPDAIKLLEKIKAANDEVLAKQKAALEKLEEVQDAADQLRIFAKRG